MKIARLDHLVLTVTDLDRACEFYSRVLGMEVVTFAGDRKALHFGEQKINLHQRGREIEPKALMPTPGSADICLIAAIPLSEVMEHLQKCRVNRISDPVRRTGARGAIESIYIRDPDGNLIEIANYQ